MSGDSNPHITQKILITSNHHQHPGRVHLALAALLAVALPAALLSPGVATAQSVPGKPSLSLTVSGQAGKMFATWYAPGSGGSAITGYQLQYKASSDQDWTDWPSSNFSTTPGGLWNTKITGLTPGTTYEGRLRAQNSAGYGPWSDVKSLTLPGVATPGKPVLEVGQTRLQHGQIYLSWDKPTNTDANTGHEVQYKGGSITDWTDSSNGVSYNGTWFSTTLTGLEDGTTYQLRARSVNTAGVAGQWSDVAYGRTRYALKKAGLIPYSRHKQRDGLGGRGSIGVAWINRNPKPCVTFEVQYKGGSITDWTDQPVNIYDFRGNIEVPTSVDVTGLDDSTEYEIKVRSVTYDHAPCEGGAEGPWTVVVSAPTPQYDKPTIWFGQHGAPTRRSAASSRYAGRSRPSGTSKAIPISPTLKSLGTTCDTESPERRRGKTPWSIVGSITVRSPAWTTAQRTSSRRGCATSQFPRRTQING